MPAKGCHHSEEAKAKIAAAHRGMKRTPEQIEKHATALRGRKKSPLPQETRDKISAAQRGRKRTPEEVEKNRLGHIGQPSARQGVTLSEETKQKVRDARAKQVHPRLARRGITAEIIADAETRGLRWCAGKCKQFVPASEFYSDNPSIRICIRCSRAANNEKVAAYTPEERAARAVYMSQYRIGSYAPEERRRALLRRYGVTPDWYEEQYKAQGGHCALCDAVKDTTKLPARCLITERKYLLVDHDHETGKARGLLCAKCNTALHRVEYVTNWAINAMAYLEKHGSARKSKGASSIGVGVV